MKTDHHYSLFTFHFSLNILQNSLESETLVPNKTRLKPNANELARLKPSVPYMQSAFSESACLHPNYLVQ
ncbi:hypothetical protein GSY74_10295, partial [Sulfurovum sp. bin170]|uniref:hypothetical protein n=1 Tax=Sulfurovum sp. bin170 TaxID=2695268 RepID=UPI0013DE8664